MPDEVWQVRYVRLQRSHTDSWMTYELNRPAEFGDRLARFLAKELPGWQMVSGMCHDPHEGSDGLP